LPEKVRQNFARRSKERGEQGARKEAHTPPYSHILVKKYYCQLLAQTKTWSTGRGISKNFHMSIWI